MRSMFKPVAQAIKAVGGNLDTESKHAYYVEAPPGYRWIASGATTLCIHVYPDHPDGWWEQAAYIDVVDRMKYGLERCTPEESTQVEYDRDEPWVAPEGSPKRIRFDSLKGTSR